MPPLLWRARWIRFSVLALSWAVSVSGAPVVLLEVAPSTNAENEGAIYVHTNVAFNAIVLSAGNVQTELTYSWHFDIDNRAACDNDCTASGAAPSISYMYRTPGRKTIELMVADGTKSTIVATSILVLERKACFVFEVSIRRQSTPDQKIPAIPLDETTVLLVARAFDPSSESGSIVDMSRELYLLGEMPVLELIRDETIARTTPVVLDDGLWDLEADSSNLTIPQLDAQLRMTWNNQGWWQIEFNMHQLHSIEGVLRSRGVLILGCGIADTSFAFARTILPSVFFDISPTENGTPEASVYGIRDKRNAPCDHALWAVLVDWPSSPTVGVVSDDTLTTGLAHLLVYFG